MDLQQHLARQAAFSRATFGPGQRTKGVIDHIKKELKEVAIADNCLGKCKEWTDVSILGFDGLLRACRSYLEEVNPFEKIKITNSQVADMAVRLLLEKQEINELRDWPDWRTMSEDKAIEHDRSKEG